MCAGWSRMGESWVREIWKKQFPSSRKEAPGLPWDKAEAMQKQISVEDMGLKHNYKALGICVWRDGLF